MFFQVDKNNNGNIDYTGFYKLLIIKIRLKYKMYILKNNKGLILLYEYLIILKCNLNIKFYNIYKWYL